MRGQRGDKGKVRGDKGKGRQRGRQREGKTKGRGRQRGEDKGDTPPYFHPKDFDGSGVMHGGKVNREMEGQLRWCENKGDTPPYFIRKILTDRGRRMRDI